MTNPLESETALLTRRLAAALDRIDAALAAKAHDTARLHRIEASARDTLAGLDALLADGA